MNQDRQQHHLGCTQRRARHAGPARLRGLCHLRQCIDKLVIAQNLIGRCDNAGLAIVRPDWANGGTGTDNTVSNNIFTRCDRAAIVFLNQQNHADGNVYAKMPANFLG